MSAEEPPGPADERLPGNTGEQEPEGGPDAALARVMEAPVRAARDATFWADVLRHAIGCALAVVGVGGGSLVVVWTAVSVPLLLHLHPDAVTGPLLLEKGIVTTAGLSFFSGLLVGARHFLMPLHWIAAREDAKAGVRVTFPPDG